jgi:glycosyltransferase involved in cell wall biosynthesis
MSASPLVTVIIATYNRSRVLAHAVESVRRSTLHDWELIVVGDHCTDDSAEVVAACGDPRVRFVNLPRNTGEQSGPSNEGVRLARGRYLAFLNHDDMYFEEHLASAVAFCEQSKADMVWVPIIVAVPTSERELAEGKWRLRLSGVPPDGVFDPAVFTFASAWVLTRELAARVGPWRQARDSFVPSSQDWLFRMWRSGATMKFCPTATVFAVPAGDRGGSYAASASPEHDYFAGQMKTNRRFRASALEVAAIAAESEANRYRLGVSWVKGLRGVLFRPVGAAAVALGMHPLSPFFALRYGRKGNFIDAVRRRAGLQKLARH